MALSSNWFAGVGSPSYTDIRCDFDNSGASYTSTTVGSDRRGEYGPCGWLVFMPNKRDTNTELNQKDPEYGYVWAERDSDSVEVGLRYVYHNLRSAPATSRATDEYLRRPFCDPDLGSGAWLYWIVTTGGSDTCSIFIFQPYAWYGRTCQVIASMLIGMGLSTSYIDQTAFSASDDAQAALGATPADDEEPFAFYRRQIGMTIGDAVKEITRTCWDLLTINLEGEIALMPRTGVPAGFTVASVDQEDGVISVQWRYAYEHLVNQTVASEGRYYDVTLDSFGGGIGDAVASCTEVAFPQAASTKRALPFQEFEDSTSQTRYGTRSLGREVDLQEGAEVKTIRSYHLPYLCNIEGASSGDPMDALETIMARLEDTDSLLRREVTIVQDLRGMDTDVGYKVTSLGVTNDGDTFAAFCIKKTIDFNDLSVTSTLLEEPS